jgi:hypothetical protein
MNIGIGIRLGSISVRGTAALPAPITTSRAFNSGGGQVGSTNTGAIPADWVRSEATVTSVIFANDNSVTSIGSYAFAYTGLTSVTIPNSVTSIGSAAFRYCGSLTGSLNVPSSVTSIGAYAFGAAPALTTLTIPNSVTVINNNIIEGCTVLTDAYLNQPLNDINPSAFTSSSLTTIHIRPSPNTPAGWTIGSGQTICGKSGVTVAADWTTYPNPP